MKDMDKNVKGSRIRSMAKADLLLLALFVVPLAVILGKLSPFPTSALFSHFFSLSDLPEHFDKVVEGVLFVPLGAVVVVIFRLTLGIRVLGLFRPILLAMAFNIIGIPISLAFLVFVLAVIVLLRPLLMTSHNYARIAVLLSLVAALLLAPLMLSKWWDVAWLRGLSYFPVIALCLTCESFAKTLDTEGMKEAVWRTAATVLAATIITTATSISGVLGFLSRFPELLLMQAGCVLLISRHLNLRLFEGVNPLTTQSTHSIGAASKGTLSRESQSMGD